MQMLVRKTKFRKQREYAQESAPVETGIAQYRVKMMSGKELVVVRRKRIFDRKWIE